MGGTTDLAFVPIWDERVFFNRTNKAPVSTPSEGSEKHNDREKEKNMIFKTSANLIIALNKVIKQEHPV